MFGIAGIKNIIIASTIAFLVGGIAGWRVEAWRSNAAFYKAQVVNLQTQLKARDAAAKKDAKQIEQDQQQIDELKRKADDAENRISPGQCLDSDDADRVRDLWK